MIYGCILHHCIVVNSVTACAVWYNITSNRLLLQYTLLYKHLYSCGYSERQTESGLCESGALKSHGCRTLEMTSAFKWKTPITTFILHYQEHSEIKLWLKLRRFLLEQTVWRKLGRKLIFHILMQALRPLVLPLFQPYIRGVQPWGQQTCRCGWEISGIILKWFL